MNAKILVAGVGNIFLGDDAFGVEVAQRLARAGVPEGVRVVDFGIRSFDLAYAVMEPWDLVILVDAIPGGQPPGTIYTIEPEMPESGPEPAPPGFDAHTLNPAGVLQWVAALGGKPGPLLLVGCEPASVEETGQFGLSPPVEAAVPEAIAIIQQLIRHALAATAA